MRFPPFTVSLSPEIQVNTSESGYTLSRSPGDGEGVRASALSMPAGQGLEKAIALLQAGQATPDRLMQMAERKSPAAGEQFALALQQLEERGWLDYAVPPLAVAIPTEESARLDLDAPHWTRASASLSPSTSQRASNGGMVLESPHSKFRVKLTDWRASAILAQLAQPRTLGRITPPPQIGPETAYQFLNLLWATGFLEDNRVEPSAGATDFESAGGNLAESSAVLGEATGNMEPAELLESTTSAEEGEIANVSGSLDVEGSAGDTDSHSVEGDRTESIASANEATGNLEPTELPESDASAAEGELAIASSASAADAEAVAENADSHSAEGALAESSLSANEATGNLEPPAAEGELAISSDTWDVKGLAENGDSGSVAIDGESIAVAETETEPHPAADEKVDASADNISAEAKAIAPSASSALHPHDLDDRIPGLADLRNQTLGDPRVTIVIIDGNPDHTLSCFEGAEISKVFPYWHEPAEPIPAEAYAKFRAIENNDDLDEGEKADALEAAFPDPVLGRILGDNHACHITSTIVGQENTPSPGLAPRCSVINIPINTTGVDVEFISPLNLARAFELALNLGANLIHCAACRPTKTGEGEELLREAVKKCQDNNILIVAPAGNNKGECWCLPACLPGVLSVGALKPDGTPYKFSNWGGNNALEGIMAPGGEILGAQPATEEPIRQKGTSMSAPVMTGLCALLASLQLQQGKPIDTDAIRAALLNTATPCDPDVVEEPERCLRGIVNLPGAMGLLFGQSVTISFPGDRVTRTEHAIAPASPASSASAHSVTPSLAEERPSITCTPGLIDTLAKLGVSLLISGYEGELTIICPNGEIRNIPFSERKLTGIAGDREKLALSNDDRIWKFQNINVAGYSDLDLSGDRCDLQHDACYKLESVGETPGNLNTHEIAWIDGEVWFINTTYSCLCSLQKGTDYIVRWYPPFVSELSHGDRCHLNGLGVRDGKVRYVTALGETDSSLAWYDRRDSCGILMDIETNEILLRGLSMPHSPRWYNDRLWFTEASKGSLVRVNLSTKEVETVAELPGFTRGLDFVRDVAFVGTTSCRPPLCPEGEMKHVGVWAVDLKTGETLGHATFEQGVIEISAVKALSGIHSPMLLGWPEEQLQAAERDLAKATPQPLSPILVSPSLAQSILSKANATSQFLTPSTAHSGHVYALGTIGYDFGNAARRDTFKQNMAPVNLDGVMVPADPYDPRQMLEHLDRNPHELHSLIWTLNIDGNPIYALDPKGHFAKEVREIFLQMLAGHLEPETSAEFVERISVPARRTNRTVELFSGEVLPVIHVHHPRGMYGWNVNGLIDTVLATLGGLEGIDEEVLREELAAFLNQVYHDLHNLGQTSRDRALNFTVTNTFQAASTFAQAIASGRQLDTIEVKKSPYCRLNSDCWDILLTFFDPEDGKRSRQVFRFTIDVVDSVPVTVGSIKSWSLPGKGTVAKPLTAASVPPRHPDFPAIFLPENFARS